MWSPGPEKNPPRSSFNVVNSIRKSSEIPRVDVQSVGVHSPRTGRLLLETNSFFTFFFFFTSFIVITYVRVLRMNPVFDVGTDSIRLETICSLNGILPKRSGGLCRNNDFSRYHHDRPYYHLYTVSFGLLVVTFQILYF